MPKTQYSGGKIRLEKKIFNDAVNYYRKRPDEFCEDVVGIKINVYQKLMLRAIFKYDYVMFIMCRGLGKTFLAMLALVILALLYPSQKIGIIAPSFRQGKLLIQEKYKDEFCNWSQFIVNEEKAFVCNNAKARIDFYNGSFIEAFPVGVGSGTNAASKIRGARLTIALCDEAVYINPEIIENVLIPMLIVKSGYKVGDDGEDDNAFLNNKLIITSSAGYRFNHLYDRYCTWTKEMIKPDNVKYFTLTLPWQVGVAVGLFKEDFIMQQKATMIEERFQQEYEGIFPKLVDGAWVSYSDLQECSDLYKIETSGVKGYDYLMAVDVARVEGGDNTIADVFKIHWCKDHAEVDLVYTRSMNGEKFYNQAREIRELLQRFPNTKRIFMDTNGLGVGLADELAKPYYDEVYDAWFPAIIDVNNKEQVRKIPDGVPLIYGIKANAEINHNLGMAIKQYTQKRWLHMYNLAADENRKIDLSSEEDKLLLETEETRIELINIQNKPQTNTPYLRFFSKSKRKDRWSAMCMGVYGAQLMYKERFENVDQMEFMVGVSVRH